MVEPDRRVRRCTTATTTVSCRSSCTQILDEIKESPCLPRESEQRTCGFHVTDAHMYSSGASLEGTSGCFAYLCSLTLSLEQGLRPTDRSLLLNTEQPTRQADGYDDALDILVNRSFALDLKGE